MRKLEEDNNAHFFSILIELYFFFLISMLEFKINIHKLDFIKKISLFFLLFFMIWRKKCMSFLYVKTKIIFFTSER